MPSSSDTEEPREDEKPPTSDDPAHDGSRTNEGSAADGSDDDVDRNADGRAESADDDAASPVGGPPAGITRATGGPPRPPRRTGVFLDSDDLREHIGELLRAILGGYEVDVFGNFTFTHEGARVFVTVGTSPIGPQIGVFSVTNLDIELSIELAAFLLTTNHSLGFGAFSYDPRNRAVWLRHTLLGTTLDLPELHSAVAAIASTAAHLDERIRDRFGGRTFQEAPLDVQQRMEPPETLGDTGFPNAGGYL